MVNGGVKTLHSCIKFLGPDLSVAQEHLDGRVPDHLHNRLCVYARVTSAANWLSAPANYVEKALVDRILYPTRRS